jgi:hypothetical protein
VPELRTRVVKAAEVARHLPPDTKRSSHEERVAELRARFDAIRRRHRI